MVSTGVAFELPGKVHTGSFGHTRTKLAQLHTDSANGYSSSKQCTGGRREIIVKKKCGEGLGAVLTLHHFHVYVVYIFQLNKSLKYTAAYRAGLNFGDEIISINKHFVGTLNKKEMTTMFTESTDLILEVEESPFSTYHLVKISPKDHILGIQEYSKGKIIKVAPNSAAQRADIREGYTILQVNQKSTLGLDDRQILDILASAFRERKEITITTMITEIAEGLLTALLETIFMIDAPFSPHELIDCDFSIVSLGLQSHNPIILMLDLFVMLDPVRHPPPSVERGSQDEGVIELASEGIRG